MVHQRAPLFIILIGGFFFFFSPIKVEFLQPGYLERHFASNTGTGTTSPDLGFVLLAASTDVEETG